MRIILTLAAASILAAAAPGVAAAPRFSATETLGDDPMGRGSACVIYLGQTNPGSARARAAYARAAVAWRASLVRPLGRDGAAQLIGSSVNVLADTPPATRRAAASWCAAHPPRAR